MADVKAMVRDPEFQALPWAERHQLLAMKDPEYAALPSADQAAVMNDLKSRDWWKPTAPAEERPKSSVARRVLGDTAVSALKGAIGLPESVVGLADIVSGGMAGKALEEAGYRPKEAREVLDTFYSPEQQEANAAVQSADGFFPTLKAAVQNPSTIAHAAIESAPSMIGAGGMARGIMKVAPRVAPVIAGALGEGAMSAGSTAEQVRQETGTLTPKQAGIAAASGAATSALGVIGGKVAQKLGIADIDTFLASGAPTQQKKNVVKAVIEGMISEGALEELPQSAQEQMAQNLALGKPAGEGVGNAAAQGLITGGIMGGGGNVIANAGPLSRAVSRVDSTAVTPQSAFNDAVAAKDTLAAVVGDEAANEIFAKADEQVAQTGEQDGARYYQQVQQALNAELERAKVQPATEAITEQPIVPEQPLPSRAAAPVSGISSLISDSRQQRTPTMPVNDGIQGAESDLSSVPEEGSQGAQEMPSVRQEDVITPQNVTTPQGATNDEAAQADAQGNEGHADEARNVQAPAEGDAQENADDGRNEAALQTRGVADDAQRDEGGVAADEYGGEVLNRSGDTVTLYHGGRLDAHDAIMREGIRPNKHWGVGLAEQEAARTWAQSATNSGRGEDVIYKVEVPKSEIKKIEKDHASQAHPEWRSYNLQFGNGGNLKPEWIKAVKIGRGDFVPVAAPVAEVAPAEVLKSEGLVKPATSAPDSTRAILSTLASPKRKSDASIAKLTAAHGRDAVNQLVTSGLISFPGKGMAELTKKGRDHLSTLPRPLSPLEEKQLANLAKNGKRTAAMEAKYQGLVERAGKLAAKEAVTVEPQKDELVQVMDVYGHRHRVSKADLDNPTRTMLKRYNTKGERIVDSALHRDNIVKTDDAEAVQKAKDAARLSALEKKDKQGKLKPEELEEGKALIAKVAAQPLPPTQEAAPVAAAQGKPTPTPKATKPAAEATPAPVAKLEDFGEKIGGARKDYSVKMSEAKSLDVATEPFSKTWPEPDYKKLLGQGFDSRHVDLVRALRDEIPDKPRKSHKLKPWVSLVENLRDHAENVLQGNSPVIYNTLEKLQDSNSAVQNIRGRAELYKAVGHDVSLRGVTLKRNHWALWHGEKDVTKWQVERAQKATAFGNMPQDLGTGDSKEEAIAAFKANLHKLEPQGKAATKFNIYKYHDKDGYVIGKKAGRDYIDLKTFHTVAEARTYLLEHQADLESQLAKTKEVPYERRESNNARVGDNIRDGKNATPEMFQDAFGFRGVEFGNYLNSSDRQNNLNDAFDALHDLAAIIGVPTKALSLNGELGLAFGARGHGGKRAPMAHYEPSKVVINLTKNNGAGSLAHEWFHAVDSYLSRKRGYKDRYITDNLVKYGPQDMTRQEVIDAFKALQKSLNETGMKARSHELDKSRTKDYWSTGLEMHARAFENYVIDKLTDGGKSNDYLANVKGVSEYADDLLSGFFEGKTAKEMYPYLLPEEVKKVRGAFDGLFSTLKTEETDKGVALYSTADAPRQSLTLSRVRSSFPNQQITEDNGTFTVTTPSGVTLRISKVGAIEFDRAAAEKAYGREMAPDEYPVAEFRALPDGAIINLTEKGVSELDHEVFHFAMAAALKPGQIKAILNRFGTEEKAAAEYQRLKDSGAFEEKRGNIYLAAIFRFFRNLRELIAPTAKGAMQDVASGRVWGRAKQGRGGTKYAAAWHGSPHDFDKFKSSAIGTGEGAQAYGHGIYFASNKEVAEYYKDTLAANDIRIDGKRSFEWRVNALTKDLVLEHEGDLDIAIKKAEEWTKHESLATRTAAKIALAELKELKANDSVTVNKGRLYHVELAPTSDEYLDWDKPLSEQSEKVKAALKTVMPSMAKTAGVSEKYLTGPSSLETGRTVYDHLAEKLGADREMTGGWTARVKDDKAASEYLHSLGIRGIKYLDGTSRGKGEGNYNYVIFNESDVEIKAKYSLSRADQSMTDEQKAAVEAAFGKPPTMIERAKEFKKDLRKNLEQGIFDQYAPIKEVDMSAYMKARMTKGGDSTLEAIMLYGKPYIDHTGSIKVEFDGQNKGMNGFASALAKLDGEHDRFLKWVAGIRAARLKDIGLENLMSKETIAALKTLNRDGTAENKLPNGEDRAITYSLVLNYMNAYNDAILKLAVDRGLVNDSTRQMYKDMPYIPFYRLQDEGVVSGFTAQSGLVNQTAWKKLKGGTNKLNDDMLANMLKNWSHLITASARNDAAAKTLTKALELGAAHEVPAGYPGKGIVSFRENTTTVMKKMPDGTYRRVQGEPIPVGTKYKEAGVIKVSDGTVVPEFNVERHFIVTDPHLLDAITSIGQITKVPKPLKAFKNILTHTVTLNPSFKIRNLIRDSISSIALADLSYNPAKNVKKGYGLTAKHSETRAQMMAAGGVMRFGSMLDGATADNARKLIDSGVPAEHILDSPNKVAAFWKKYMVGAFDAYQEFGDRSEQVNRAALYQTLLEKGYTADEAAFWARDLMDFSMSGKWAAVRFLTQTVPFMNARLQGLYKLGKSAKADKKRFGIVIGGVVMASLALMTAYDGDDDWDKREAWDRDNYWWFKVGDKAFRIPKPFEIGAIGSIAEWSAELMFKKEMTGKKFATRMRDIISSQLSLNPTPQLVKPLIDLWANKDSFTQRPIESMGMDRMKPEDRATDRTSGAAKLLGQIGMPNPSQLIMGRYEGLSPVQIDFLIRGYFSWLGVMATSALDYGIFKPLSGTTSPTPKLRDVFLVGNFAETLPSNSSRYVSELYDQAKEIEQAYNSYRNAVKSGDRERAREIMENEGEKVRKYGQVNRLKEAMSDINQQIRKVTANPRYTAEEKREKIDRLKQKQDYVARKLR